MIKFWRFALPLINLKSSMTRARWNWLINDNDEDAFYFELMLTLFWPNSDLTLGRMSLLFKIKLILEWNYSNFFKSSLLSNIPLCLFWSSIGWFLCILFWFPLLLSLFYYVYWKSFTGIAYDSCCWYAPSGDDTLFRSIVFEYSFFGMEDCCRLLILSFI